MFRTTDMVLIAVMVATAALTYKTKREAELQFETNQHLQANIQAEKDKIDVLKAEWSLLTQPARLQRLTELYKDELALQPVGAEQIATLDELPMRRVDLDDLSGAKAGAVAKAATDATTTGAVKR